MSLFSNTFFLTIRALKEAIRQPGIEISNVFFPLFFLVVTIGSLAEVSSEAFGIEDYTGFSIPVAILNAAASVSTGASLGLINDIQGGYFDKLLLTPARRAALVLGRMFADGVRAMVLTAIVLAVGLFLGGGLETGVPGFVALVLLSGFFALGYSGLSAALALRTGSTQAAQLGFLLFFPLLFLSPAFAPKEIFQGWLEFLATINPVTYIVEGQRELILDGWNLAELGYALLATAGITAVSWSLTFAALAWRARGSSGPVAAEGPARGF